MDVAGEELVDVELIGLEIVVRLEIKVAVRCALAMCEGKSPARDEKKSSIDALAGVPGLAGNINWLTLNDMGGNLVPIASTPSITVSTAMAQMVLGPVDDIVMTIELVQQAPDTVAEPEHTLDDVRERKSAMLCG